MGSLRSLRTVDNPSTKTFVVSCEPWIIRLVRPDQLILIPMEGFGGVFMVPKPDFHSFISGIPGHITGWPAPREPGREVGRF